MRRNRAITLALERACCYNKHMRKNPYRIGRERGIPPRLKEKLKQLPSIKGHEGRWIRRTLIIAAVALGAVILSRFFKPEAQLMNSIEIERIESAGVLSVGVRDDMPGFCEDGVGFEAELASLLARRLLPNSDEPLKLVPCTSKTVSTKLYDGTIDVAIALQVEGGDRSYAYSYPYFTDDIHLVTLSQENTSKQIQELVVGYIPETPAGRVFESYLSGLNPVPERGIIDRLLKKPVTTPDPENTITVESVTYGSYDELLSALKIGRIDAAALAGAYVNKYCNVLAEETGIKEYYLCDIDVGSVNYCMVSSSEEPALMQLADMLIYDLKSGGKFSELTQRYLSDIPKRTMPGVAY
ncbi:MAG: transporter substrate-binding domain-containing protein [Clostridia bacterium]|nr:transporter substrate-binding domain-containing protein [Clostridia bacterium]